MVILKGVLLIFFVFSLGGCVTTQAPVEEFNLAVAALDAARQAESAKYASGFFHRANESFRRGQILYQNKEYNKARIEFEQTRVNAEKAENAARLLKWKNGEEF